MMVECDELHSTEQVVRGKHVSPRELAVIKDHGTRTAEGTMKQKAQEASANQLAHRLGLRSSKSPVQ